MTEQIYAVGCPWVAKRRQKTQQKKIDARGGVNLQTQVDTHIHEDGDREKGADIPQMGQRM